MAFNSRVVPVFMLQMTNISGPSIYYIHYISRKNDRPLYEARALVVNKCAGLL